jgi:exocyst complex component 7
MLLGDGNWKMGDGVQAKPNQGKSAPGSERILIEHYTCTFLFCSHCWLISPSTTVDVVTTLIGSLTALSRMQKRPAFGSVFLLNNSAYLCAKLLRLGTPVLEILSRPTQDAINSNFRTAKAGYFDSNFSPLLQALTDDKDKSGSGSKAAAKEKFTRFFDLLEETKERHQLARVLEDDEEQRGMLEDEVVKLVVPSFQRFTQKMREKEFSKSMCLVYSLPLADVLNGSLQTHRNVGFYFPFLFCFQIGVPDHRSTDIKMTPEEVEAQIRSFY